jgi:hypothetical protein
MSRLPLLMVVLFLACGTAQYATGPAEEVVVDGFPPPHPAQQRPGKDGRCRTPRWGPDMETLVMNGGCWTPLDATPEQCEKAHRENPYHVLYQDRCWYPMPRVPEREPSASLSR